MLYVDPKTLIVVYKDELLVNQLKKLIETNDDINEESVVGVRDGSVRIVAWTDKVWHDQKKAGNINNKVLFLGDVVDTKNLVPLMEVKFDMYGIKYGWVGNQALLVVDPTALSKEEVYSEFRSCLDNYDIPYSIKIDLPKEQEDTDTPTTTQDNPDKPKEKKGFAAIIGKTIGFAEKTAKTISAGVSKTVSQVNSAIDNLPADRTKLMKQQYYLGINKLYENNLDEFMNS